MKANDKPKTFHDIVESLDSLPAAFDQIMKFVMVVITLPVGSAASERFFSTLKIMKIYVRLTMGNGWLSNLVEISV